jgi:hypothetical protein
MEKIGSQHFKEMLDRGRRELGGILYHDSNIAQPMYPPRGGYESSKEVEPQSLDEQGSILDDRLKQADMHRDDEGREDREKGFDRD